MRKTASILMVFLLGSFALLAQPANDLCQNAINLGTLPLGSQSCRQGTNVGANPEYPYPFQNICTAGSSTPGSADDVWYTFTTPAASNEIRVTITGTLPSYSIAIYRGTCGSLSGFGCATGGSGGVSNVTIQPLAGGQTYYIQVSGNGAGAQGTFNLCLTSRDNPNLCVVQSSMTANPQPVNGSYYPGQVITFCYTVSDYNELGTNWFHGLQVIMGPGWQGSLTPVSAANSCDGTGRWGWFNSVTSSNTGMTVGPGYFYDKTPYDNNPGNNFGDQKRAGCSSWTFCWQATVPNVNCASANPDLSVRVRPFADGQTGSWTNNTCNVTPTFVFSAILQCCQQPTITKFDESCPGACDGLAVAQGQGGTAPYTYAWSNSTATDTARSLCAGSVNVSVTDAVGCLAITTVIINSGSGLNVTTASSNETCPGAADGKAWVVNASPSLTYTWNTVPPQTGDTAFALTTGTYQVTATGTAGCSATGSVNVGAGSNLSITLAKRDITCTGAANGKAWVVSGNANFTYVWNTVPPQNTDTAFNLAPGTYSVTATGAGGCTDTKSITIAEPTTLTVTATADTANCGAAGSSNAYAVAAGGTGAYGYSWNSVPPQNTATAANLPPGTYTVTVTDINGCTATATATVVSTPSFTTSTGSQNISCNGAANGKAWAVPSGGLAPYTFVWNTVPPQNTDTASNLGPGTYGVTITDANGCTDQFSFTITQPTAITATSVITNVSCNGLADGAIDITVTGGSSPYTYAWSNSGNTQDISGLVPGSYDVIITDANGCTISLTGLVITEPSPLSLSATATDVSCYGGFDGGVNLTVNGGTPTYTYRWSNNRINQNLSYVTAGTYTVTVTDRNGCTDTTSAVVAQPDSFHIIAVVDDVTCFGLADGAIDVAVTGATPPYSYEWSLNGTTYMGSSINNLSGGSYQVTVTDNIGCTKNLSYNIFEPTRLRTIITQSIDSTACNGDILQGSITNNTNGGTVPFSFLWSSGDTTRNITSNLVYGTYTVTATDAQGCTDTASTTLVPKNVLNVQLLTDSSGCYGDSSGNAEVVITGGRRPYNIVWDVDSTNESRYASNLGPGNYNVTVTDARGCDTTFNFTITEQPLMSVMVPDTITAIYGHDTTFTAATSGVRPGDAVSYYWTPSEWFSCDNCLDPVITAIRNRQYVLELNVNGCLYYDTLQLMVDYGPDPYYIPNAFTPNGDGVNDLFQIYGIGIREVQFTVHNRWGELVFKGEDLNAAWDGTYKGQNVPTGVYVVKAHFIYLDQNTETVTGSLTIIR